MQEVGPGAVRLYRDNMAGWRRGSCSLEARAVWGEEPLQGVHQLKMKQILVYTVKSNRQLVQNADAGAIGGCRGWACAGGRAIGGDALAMQVHARLWAHLPTLISGQRSTSQLRAVAIAAPSE